MDTGPDTINDTRFISETGLAAQFAGLAEPVLADLGFRLVRVTITGREGSTVQIMAERPDGTISVEDCAVISRNLSPVLDAYDPMSDRYTLEISSPGIDRPLVRPADFDDWAGYEAKIEVKEMISGRKRFRGVIDGFEAGEVRFETDVEGQGRQVIGLPVELISEARLVLTDALIREALSRAKKAAKAAGRAEDFHDGAETDQVPEPLTDAEEKN